MHAETSVRPSDQEHSDLPPPPERNEIKKRGEGYVVVARDIESRIYVSLGSKVVQQKRYD